ncbi:MAG: hypothetical protein KTR31_16855 [Myxococcales bacterium]|nr:hypothetical protein [Myxococcales bacterium]
MRRTTWWWGLLALSCGGSGAPEACPDDLTWETFGDAYMTSWCTSCHHPALQDTLRGGAPAGMNFDTYDEVAALEVLIRSSATGEQARMPPGGGPTAAQRDRLLQWLDCGLPRQGGDTPPACAPGTVAGPLQISTGADAERLCTEGSTVQGDLQIAWSGSIDCLCRVEGSVEVTAGGTVELPNLAVVTEGLEVVGNPTLQTLQAPTLQSVGWLEVRDSGLGRLQLPDLSEVQQALILEQLPLTGTLALDEVTSVGSLSLRTLPSLSRVGLSRLARAEGSVRLVEVGATELLAGPLQIVSGDLEICDNPALRSISALDRVTTVEGSFTVCRNDALQRLALGGLQDVAGDFVVIDNPALPTSEVEMLAERVTVVGEVQIEGNGP